MHTNSSVSLVLVLLEVLANAYRKTCTCFQQRETCSWNVPPKHPTHQSSSTSLPPKMNVTLIQSLPIRGYLSSIPPSPLKWSSSIRSSTIWNSKSVLPTQLLTLPSNTIFERYLELKLLPTCLPVIISSSTNIPPYRCDNTLTLSSTNWIPTTSKTKWLNLNYHLRQTHRLVSILPDKIDVFLSSPTLINQPPNRKPTHTPRPRTSYPGYATSSRRLQQAHPIQWT